MTNKEKNLIERPPVIVVLGHIDHGKTTLLDNIRKSDVVSGESGSITQHIGAYEITHNKKKLTFIDTPGHEAFSKMRSRGAKVADVAILIVAADEGLKPQTKEAIKHIKEAGLTMIVAINKIDKPDASPEKVKQQLAEEGIMLEGWGGTISNQEISAKSGKGINELLDLISLVVELEELKAEKDIPGNGVIIEAETDTKIGNTVTLIIKNGLVNTGDFLVAGNSIGKIKRMENDKGEVIKNASFSSPVRVTGFTSLPNVGEEFYITKDKKEAENLAKLKEETTSLGAKSLNSSKENKKILNIILKSDVSGTKEAIENLLNELIFEDVAVNILRSEVGNINENDIKTARLENTIIASFKVSTPNSIKKLSEQHDVKIISGSVIYELIEKVKKELAKLLPPEIIKHQTGKLQVLAVFKSDFSKIIAGGKIIDGKAKRGEKIDVKRNGDLIMTGKLSQLQHNKEDVKEVSLGKECGITFLKEIPGGPNIEVGDMLEIYKEEIKEIEL